MLEGIFGKKFDSDEYEKVKEDAEAKEEAARTMGSLTGVESSRKQAIYDDAFDSSNKAAEKVSRLQQLADKEIVANIEEYGKKREEALMALKYLYDLRSNKIASPAGPEDMNVYLAILGKFNELFPEN